MNMEHIKKFLNNLITLLFMLPAVLFWGAFLILNLSLADFIEFISKISIKYDGASISSQDKFRELLSTGYWFLAIILFIQIQAISYIRSKK
jgi:hypothetical protein